ncbi:MAG: hypothetical protein AB7P17_07435 [Nitrospirales bacterium]
MVKADPVSPWTQRSESPLDQLETLLAESHHHSSDTTAQLSLADLYLEIGQDIYQEENLKRQAFEEGARLARRVLDTEESNAEAHYLYAANLGSSAQIEGVKIPAQRAGLSKNLKTISFA